MQGHLRFPGSKSQTRPLFSPLLGVLPCLGDIQAQQAVEDRSKVALSIECDRRHNLILRAFKGQASSSLHVAQTKGCSRE